MPPNRLIDPTRWLAPPVSLQREPAMWDGESPTGPGIQSTFLDFDYAFPAFVSGEARLDDAMKRNGLLLPLDCPDLPDLVGLYVHWVPQALDLSRAVVERFKSSGRISRLVSGAFRSEVVRSKELFRCEELPADLFATDAGRDLVDGFAPSGVLWDLVAEEQA